MIQGDSGATPVEGCGLVPRGQDNPPAVPHRILWLFTEKGTNPGPNVANEVESPQSSVKYQLYRIKKFFSSSYRKGSDTMDSLCFSDKNQTKYHANRTTLTQAICIPYVKLSDLTLVRISSARLARQVGFGEPGRGGAMTDQKARGSRLVSYDKYDGVAS